jgi:DNA-binding response OmpR family regulator
MDHGSIRGLLESKFGCDVLRTHGLADTLAALRQSPAALVLVNRVLDRDGGAGMDVLAAIKSDEQLAGTPVMLVTNFPESQSAAIAAGAVPGFGKNSLHDPKTLELLRPFVGLRE